jgi:hypothetical protein
MISKIKGGTVATVATGEVEIAIRPVSELINVPGIDFVGPVPEEVQYLSIFSAAIVAGSQHVDGGQRMKSVFACRCGARASSRGTKAGGRAGDRKTLFIITYTKGRILDSDLDCGHTPVHHS